MIRWIGIFCIYFISFDLFSQSWQPLGEEVTITFHNIGRSLAANKNGTSFIIGNSAVNLGDFNNGFAMVYERKNNSWLQKGETIFGDTTNGLSGFAVAMNAEGNVIAIGAPGKSVSGTNSGAVKIYHWIGSKWEQKGETLTGTSAADRSGRSISISEDGNIVAFGSRNHDNRKGNVRIFQWNGIKWNQLGSDLKGLNEDDHFGYALHITPDGKTLAVGANFSWDNGQESGYTQVFDWNGSAWNERGKKLSGLDTFGYFGSSVKLSVDGSVLAVGSTGANDQSGNRVGSVKIFQWQNGEWQQKGQTIFGKQKGEQYGHAVELSEDGNLIISSSIVFGRIESLEWYNSKWNLKYQDLIDGTSNLNHFGYAIDLNADQNQLIVTSALKMNQFGKYGNIETYQSSCNSISRVSVNDCKPYRSPSGKYIWTTSGTYFDTLKNHLSCDSIIYHNLKFYKDTSLVIYACKTYTSPSGKYLWSTNGRYFDTLTASNGCDSIIDITLNFSWIQSMVDISECNEYKSPSGKYIWRASGQYLDTLRNSEQCDSTITIQLNILNTKEDKALLICEPTFTSPSGKYIWDSPGQYFDTIKNSNGCDHFISLDLKFGIPTDFSYDEIKCGRMLSPSKKYFWDSSGIYKEKLINSSGCDSTITVDLTIHNHSWNQKGQLFYGEGYNIALGVDVELSSDGQTLSLNKPGSGVLMDKTGQVDIYRWNGIQWELKGNPIKEQNGVGDFGLEMDLNSDGSAIIISNQSALKGSDAVGSATVYYWNGQDWEQKGKPIYGDIPYEKSSRYVRISDDANTVFISSVCSWHPMNILTGRIRVFSWNGMEWIQKGKDITGDSIYCNAVFMSINSEGSIFATTMHGSNNPRQVRIYKWNGVDWEQRGNDIVAKLSDNSFGHRICLDSTGNRIAISSPTDSDFQYYLGRIFVYEWKNEQWVKLGNELSGENEMDKIGIDMKMNRSGNRIIASGSNGFEKDRNIVYTYEWNGKHWTRYGCEIPVLNDEPQVGYSVEISNDGKIVAMGNPNRNIQTGQVVCYELCNYDNTSYKQKSCSSILSPSGSKLWDKSGKYTEVLKNIFGCDSIISVYLEVNAINDSIINLGNSIESIDTTANYQWLNCDQSYEIIPGENLRWFVPKRNGSYAVELTKGFCKDTTICVSVTTVSTSSISKHQYLSYYPNPSNGKVYFESKQNSGSMQYIIRDNYGKIISNGTIDNSTKFSINLPDQSAIYTLELISRNKSYRIKLIRI
jgi:hypothetical protein